MASTDALNAQLANLIQRLGVVTAGMERIWSGSENETVNNGAQDLLTQAGLIKKALEDVDGATQGAIAEVLVARDEVAANAQLAVAASLASGGPLKTYASYDDPTAVIGGSDGARLADALPTLDDGLYEVLSDETLGGVATRYTVAGHVATFLTTLEAALTAVDMSPAVVWAKPKQATGRGSTALEEKVQALLNRTEVIKNATVVEDGYAGLRALPFAVLGSDRKISVRIGYRTAAGDGGGGDFRWISGDQSANVAADPDEGLWVAPASAPSGASGAWQRVGYFDAAAFSSIPSAMTAFVAQRVGQLDVPVGDWVITSPIAAAAWRGISGKSGARTGGTRLMPDASYAYDYLGYLNVDPNNPTTWLEQFPNTGSGVTRDLHVDCTARPSTKGFLFAGSHEFRDIQATKVGTLIAKVAGVYADVVKIARIHAKNRANTTDYLVYLPDVGDCVEISQVSPGYWFTGDGNEETDPSLTPGKGIYLGPCRGGTVTGIINGVNYFNNSIVDISACHLERGSHTIADGKTTFRDSVLYTEANVGTPLIYTSVLTSYVAEHALKNVTFDARPVSRGGWNSTTRADLEVAPPTNLTIEGCSRRAGVISSLIGYFGVMPADGAGNIYPEWASYSHILSRDRVTIEGGTTAINGIVRSLLGKTFTGLTLPASQITFDGFTWTEAPGTYYYAAQLVIDPVRRIGLAPTGAEIVVTKASGDPAIDLQIAWGTVNVKRGVMIEIYRGDETGLYNKKCSLPILAANHLFDQGLSISNFGWTARTAAPMDALNASGHCGRLVLEDGIARLETSMNILPTIGTWKMGDVVRKRLPTVVASGAYTTLEFVRLTDGSDHVDGVDWMMVGGQRA